MDNKVKRAEMTLDEKKKVIAESGVVLGIILLLCYFFGFSYVWNTDYGSEASVNGWNYVIAFFSGNYKGTGAVSAVLGNIGVPFNLYAKTYVRVLAVSVTISMGILLLYVVASCLNIKKYHAKLELVCMILLYVLAVSYLECIIVALTMNGSKILPIYCSRNPKCSIATLAFFPFFITLIAAIVHSVFIYKSKQEE